jgi:hypothetical protein
MGVTQMTNGYGQVYPGKQSSFDATSERWSFAAVARFLDAVLLIWDNDRIQAKSQIKVAAAMLRAFEHLTQFNPEPRPEVRRAIQNLDKAGQFLEKRVEPVGAAPTKVSFGPFSVIPKQFLLLEGDRPVPLGGLVNERLLIAVAHSKAASPVSANSSHLCASG